METRELITIEEKNILACFTGDGLDSVVIRAKEEVSNFEHDLSTGVGRKKTASLAAKVSKLKVRLDDIGKDLVAKWKSDAKLVDNSRKSMRDDLDVLRDLARKPLTDWEDEQKLITAKKLEEEEAKKQQAIVDADHELAIEQYKNHLREVEDKKQADELAANLLAEQQKKDQIARDKKLKEDAASAAKLQAENAAKETVRLAEKAKQDAIDRENKAKIDAAVEKQNAINLAARLKQNTIDAENKAKQDAINAEWLAVENNAYNDDYIFNAERKAVLEAKQAEQRRLNDIETARLAEVKRQQDEQAVINAETARREADTKYKTKVHKGIIAAFVGVGISEENAIKAMKLLVKNMVPQVTVNY